MKNTLTLQANKIGGSVRIPGSKSYTNRALLLAALTEGSVVINSPLESDDVDAMVDCLTGLGIEVEKKPEHIIVHGSYKDINPHKEYSIHARISGTTIRFVTPLAAFSGATVHITGETGLQKRPIKDLVDSLRELGADIRYAGAEGYPPLIVHGSPKVGTIHTCTVSGTTSSQYLSALLMVAPLIGGMTLTIKDELISKPYVAMTLDTMKHFGAVCVEREGAFTVGAEPYHASSYSVEGDFSSAGYFFAIAALSKATIRICNVNPDSAQPDRKLMDVFAQMGATYKIIGGDCIEFTGGGVLPTTCDMLEFPDQAQTLGVAAAFARGVTVLKNIQSLRVKETERAAALQAELEKMGIRTESTHDTITIYGGEPHAAAIDTYGDHRMAMSFAVASTRLAGVQINNPEVVEKTFPTFWEALKGIGIESN